MKTIFIVEDDENIRELVLYALNSSGFQGVGFEDGEAFFKGLKSSIPDLILLDIMLPGENGLKILKKLRSDGQKQRIPVILLTAKGSEYDKVIGLDSGADDYIVKPFSVLELIARIKAMFRRLPAGTEPSVKEEKLTFNSITIDSERHTVTADNEAVTLTYKEFELLQYLMHNQGIAVTREQIMNRIWGFDFEGESRTVDMHIKTLRKKLGNAGNDIHTIRGIGYKLGE